jgi:hypothetical protein
VAIIDLIKADGPACSGAWYRAALAMTGAACQHQQAAT